MAAVPRRPPSGADVTYIGLVLNERGLDRALAAGVDEINVVVAASETFSRRNQDSRRRSDARRGGRDRRPGGGGRAAGAAWSSRRLRVPVRGRGAAGRRARDRRPRAAAGTDEIAVADTIGVGVPRQVHELRRGDPRAARRGRRPAARALPQHPEHRVRERAGRRRGRRRAHWTRASAGSAAARSRPNATGNIATEDLDYLLERSGWTTGLGSRSWRRRAPGWQQQLSITAPALLGRAGAVPARRADLLHLADFARTTSPNRSIGHLRL